LLGEVGEWFKPADCNYCCIETHSNSVYSFVS